MPHGRVDERAHAHVVSMAVVELGDAEHLEAQGGAAPIAGQQRGRRAEAAAGALPSNGEPLGVDAQLSGVVVEPHERGVAVLHPRRERVLGREAVLDHRDDRADLARDLHREADLHLDRADDEPTAVDVEERRPAGGGGVALRRVDAHEDVGAAVRARRVAIGHGDPVEADARVGLPEHLGDHRPCRREVVDRVEGRRRQHLDEWGELGIVGVGHGAVLYTMRVRAAPDRPRCCQHLDSWNESSRACWQPDASRPRAEAAGACAVAPDEAALEALLARRERGEPLAWITARATFCDRVITVHPGVFVPRAQTEELARRAAALVPPAGRASICAPGVGPSASTCSRPCRVRRSSGSTSTSERSRAPGPTASPRSWPTSTGCRCAPGPSMSSSLSRPTCPPATCACSRPTCSATSLGVPSMVATTGSRSSGAWWPRRRDCCDREGRCWSRSAGAKTPSSAPDLSAAGFDRGSPWYDDDGDLRGLAALLRYERASTGTAKRSS